MKRHTLLLIVIILATNIANAQILVPGNVLSQSGLVVGRTSIGLLDPDASNGRIHEAGLCPAVVQDDDALTSLDRKVMENLTGVKETEHVVFHYRPADLAGEDLENVVKINVEKFEECKKLLNMEYRGRIHIFLYRDADDLKKTTGASAAAFSTGTVSVHQPADFQSVHELTHIFAMQFPRDEDSVTDRFAVEGLATILAESDQNVPIHAWAAVYKSTSRLPDLIEFRRSWPKGCAKGVHPYHVAGSFVGYLIEQHGIDKVKRWYVNSTEAHMEFGKTIRRLEREWLDWLDKQVVEPAHRDHVFARLGLKKIPDAYVNAKTTKLFDGKSLSGLKAEEPSKWKVQDGRIVGTNPGPWTRLYSQQEFPANIGVRAKFRLVDGDAVKIQLNSSKASVNESVMARWGTFLSVKDGGFTSGGKTKIVPGEWNEVVLVNDNGTARLYLNGILARELKNQFHSSEGVLGIGVEKGTVEVTELNVFETLMNSQEIKRALLIVVPVGPGGTCTAFVVYCDGRILAGNNEDFWLTDTTNWYVPNTSPKRKRVARYVRTTHSLALRACIWARVKKARYVRTTRLRFGLVSGPE